MKFVDLVIRSGDSLGSAKSRTFLTTLAIGVGALAMTLGLALNNGGAEYAERVLTANIDGHSLWVMKKQDESSTLLRPSRATGTPAVWFNKLSVTPLIQNDLDAIASIKGVSSVDPVFVIDDAVVSRHGQDDKRYQGIVNIAREGAHRSYLAGNDTKLGSSDIILPDGYREALGFTSAQDAIDKKVDITVTNTANAAKTEKTMTFTVRGVIQRSSLSLSVAPMAVLVSADAARTLSDDISRGTVTEGTFVAGSAKINADDDLETVKQRVIDAGYFAQTPNDVYSAMYQFVGVLRFVLILFGIIAVLTSLFGIVNTQYISVLERTQEIGLMKAVGMSQKSVKKLFEIEAGLIGCIGSTVGALLAYIIGTATNPLVTSLLDLDSDMSLMQFNFVGMISVIGILSLTALIAGIMPAKRAANLDPITALRTD